MTDRSISFISWRMDDQGELLGHLLESFSLSYNTEGVVSALRSNHCSSPNESFRRAAEVLGLRVKLLEGTVDDALRKVSSECSLLFSHQDQEHWFLVTLKEGGKLTLECPDENRQITPDELKDLLGGAGEVLEWIEIAVATPMHSMKSDVLVSPDSGVKAATPLQRLLSLIKIERKDIGVVVVFAIGVGILSLATPITMQALVNAVSFGVFLQPLVMLSVLLLGGLIFAGVLRAMEVWVVEVLQRRLFVRLVGDVAYRLPRVQNRVFDQSHGPELVNRFFDIFTVKKVGSWILLEGLEISLTVLIGMLVLAFYHPLLLAFDVVLLLAILLIMLLGKGAGKTAIKESKAKYAVAHWLEEMVRHPFAFKNLGGAEFGFLRADTLTRDYLHARHKHFKVVMRQVVGVLAVQALATTGLVAVGGWLVIQQELTLGQLVAAELIVSVVVGSMLKLSRYLEQVYDLVAAIDKVGQLVDLPLESNEGHWVSSARSPKGASLVMRGVCFGFVPSKPLFKNADLDVASGERVAIGGPGGSGKSALLDMIFGARQPSAGALSLDGEDIRSLRVSSLRSRVAVVRSPEIFEGSVWENLTLGRAGISVARVEKTLCKLGLAKTVASLPNGLHTTLASGAPILSNSQAVRLTIARAVLTEPALLVVDDVLSRCSEATACSVTDVLADPENPWTLIMITDDPQLQPRCGRVLQLIGGQFKEVQV